MGGLANGHQRGSSRSRLRLQRPVPPLLVILNFPIQKSASRLAALTTAGDRFLHEVLSLPRWRVLHCRPATKTVNSTSRDPGSLIRRRHSNLHGTIMHTRQQPLLIRHVPRRDTPLCIRQGVVSSAWMRSSPRSSPRFHKPGSRIHSRRPTMMQIMSIFTSMVDA